MNISLNALSALFFFFCSGGSFVIILWGLVCVCVCVSLVGPSVIYSGIDPGEGP